MSSLNEIQIKWNSINSLSGGFLLVGHSNELSFHIGYTNSINKCLMILGVSKRENIPSSIAITAEYVLLENGHYALKFVLNYPSLDELFIKLCWDLINMPHGSGSCEYLILQRYKNWMKLLQKGFPNLLSVKRQKGLIGELLYLEEQIQTIGEDKAVEAWVGPEGSDQDYIFFDTWSEIKTTTIASDSIVISSIQQLDGIFPGSLIVFFMDKTTSSGKNVVSLSGLVDRILLMLNNKNRDIFMCKLALVGFLEKDAKAYSEVKFIVKEKRVYKVDVSFPKLTGKNVPSEIVNVRYELSLSAIDQYRVR